jgi:arylsulfatase A-like enzyme/Tfp pilus assembly protein PilF
MAARKTPPPAAPPPRPRSGLALLALLLAIGTAMTAVVVWVSRPPRSVEEARRRLVSQKPAQHDLNVLFITIDTLRADRLGCYGFTGVETPRIDGLAGESVVFDRVTSTAPLTLPSHTSIFTGLVPPHHGVRDNGGFFLDAAKTTLAERFKAAGYATGAFVGAWVLDSKWGLAQGFDTYADHFDLSKYKILSLGTVQKPGDEVADGALAWLATVANQRFFAWVHLYDPHSPYDPPEPYRTRYAQQPYLGEIAYTDHVVGRLLDFLKERRIAERTLVVVTADHGESLGEHGEATHAYFIYAATTHVPLVIHTPWGYRGRSAAPASSVDIFPTVLDLAGLAPEPGIDGRSLVPTMMGGALPQPSPVAYSETYFPRYHFGWQHLRGLRDGAWSYIDAPHPELYDLAADPGERNNVYKANSRRAEDLRLRLESLVGAESAAAPQRQSLDPDTLQRLAALGYVGNATETDPHAVLPDPKDKLRLFNLMGRAKDAAQNEHLEEAMTMMREVLAEDPQIVDAHVTLGNWLLKSKRYDEAIAAFKEALALKPDNDVAMIDLALVYRTKGQTEAAIEGYRGALKLDPKNPQVWYQLATIYLDLGRTDQAEATFREALQANPAMGAAYNSLGAIVYGRGQLASAEKLIREGLAKEPKVRTGHFNLARILEARGERAEAEALYREELAIYPDHGKARFNLAQLLRERGDREGALAELAAGVEKAPEFGACYFYLARERLESGDLDAAADLAQRGLAVDGLSEVAPLGHYVLADVYNRRGQPARAQEEVAQARRVEARAKQPPGHRL